MDAPETVGIIGAGLMGHGIAQVFAAQGHPVRLFDTNEAILAQAPERIRANLMQLAAHGIGDETAINASLARISLVRDLAEACLDADVVIEAVSEKMDLKQRIFAELDHLCPPQTILCSNTSALSITEIASKSQGRERIMGTHWWNPPYLVPLVEIVRTVETAERHIDAIYDLLTRIGKKPVRVQKDVPGFIGNRLQHALWREAFALIDQGICDAATIDEVVCSGFGLRLPILGPVANADLVGLDLVLAVHEYLFPYLSRDTTPSTTLRARIAEGKLGFKTKAGFLPWSEEEIAATRERLANHLMKMLTEQQRNGRTEPGVQDAGREQAGQTGNVS
jgi:3-hydroxybutyryl-CoA dehydrogenase